MTADVDDPKHALVLIHGWTVTATVNWGGVLAQMGPHYRVLAPDLHGHGGGHRLRKRFTLEACADDVIDLLDAEGIDDAVVAGYSLGGAVAQLVWQRHRSRVRGLVLCATAPWFRDHPKEWVNSFALRGAAALARQLPLRVRNAAGMREAARRTGQQLFAVVASELSGHDWALVTEAGARIMAFDSRPWIGSIDVPTAVVVTVDDTVVPAFRQFTLADTIPGAQLLTMTGDHSVCLREPERFGRILTQAVGFVANEHRQDPAREGVGRPPGALGTGRA